MKNIPWSTLYYFKTNIHLHLTMHHNTTPPQHHPTTPPRHSTWPHHLATPSHLTSPPNHNTTPPYHNTSPPHTTSPPHLTSPPHHTNLPPNIATPPHHPTTTPSQFISPCHLTTPPHLTTSPHHTTPPRHLATPPHLNSPHHLATIVVKVFCSLQRTVASPFTLVRQCELLYNNAVCRHCPWLNHDTRHHTLDSLPVLLVNLTSGSVTYSPLNTHSYGGIMVVVMGIVVLHAHVYHFRNLCLLILFNYVFFVLGRVLVNGLVMATGIFDPISIIQQGNNRNS